jgi:hypothetical protein
MYRNPKPLATYVYRKSEINGPTGIPKVSVYQEQTLASVSVALSNLVHKQTIETDGIVLQLINHRSTNRVTPELTPNYPEQRISNGETGS